MFEDRLQAGKKLASLLEKYKDSKNALVLALPRGGVVLGAEISKHLNLPLDIIMVRKLGHKNYPEYAIGALAENEPAIYNQREALLAGEVWLKEEEEKARKLMNDRIQLYFGDRPKRKKIENKTAILVDDGIATGFTMQVAISATKNNSAKKIVVAIPVAPTDSISRLKQSVDEVVVADDPKNYLGAVGSHYYRFDQVNDDEVKRLLKNS